ncbi:MAG: hypothetical protein WDM78_22220 [Puia sp.]
MISRAVGGRWKKKLMARFGKKPDMEAILFLIGIQEVGDFRTKFSKETKAGPDARSRLQPAFSQWLLRVGNGG